MNFSRAFFIVLVLAVCSSGCKKESTDGPVHPQTFEWNVDNGGTQTAETISFIRIASNNYIYATKGTTEVFLSTAFTTPGTYTSLLTNGNMGLTLAGKQYANLACEITITSNTNSRLKGIFNGTFGLINVDTVSVTGFFEDVAF